MGKHSKKKHVNNVKIKNKKKFIIAVLRLILIFVLVYSLVEIIKWYNNNKKSREILKNISNTIIVDKNTNSTEELEQQNYYENINFSALKEVNEDTIGYLKVNGTEVAYPVVQAKDNDFYLNHSFDKTSNSAGWIFADYRNTVDGTDKNVIIYGHNRRDGSMFYTLKNILNKEWYEKEENLKVKFITEAENSIFQVFSVYQIEAEEYYTKTNFKNNEEYETFLNTLLKRSVNNFNIELTAEDKILTLSTCANNNKYRVVLHAKKVN